MDMEDVWPDRYLGLHLNNKLDWKDNIDVTHRKDQSLLYLLRRLFWIMQDNVPNFLWLCGGISHNVCSGLPGWGCIGTRQPFQWHVDSPMMCKGAPLQVPSAARHHCPQGATELLHCSCDLVPDLRTLHQPTAQQETQDHEQKTHTLYNKICFLLHFYYIWGRKYVTTVCLSA